MKCIRKSSVKKSPLKLGKETYGKQEPSKIFNDAFAPYFSNEQTIFPINSTSNPEKKLATG